MCAWSRLIETCWLDWIHDFWLGLSLFVYRTAWKCPFMSVIMKWSLPIENGPFTRWKAAVLLIMSGWRICTRDSWLSVILRKVICKWWRNAQRRLPKNWNSVGEDCPGWSGLVIFQFFRYCKWCLGLLFLTSVVTNDYYWVNLLRVFGALRSRSVVIYVQHWR